MGFKDFLQKQGLSELRTRLIDAGLSYLLPILGTAMTFASGLLPGSTIPWPYLFAACGLVFMGLSVGASYFHRLLTHENPHGRFTVAASTFHHHRTDAGQLIGIKYGITLYNLADFPIEFKFVPENSSLGTNFNPDPERNIHGAIVAPKHTGTFMEASVPVDSTMWGKKMTGRFKFTVEYGKIGKLRHKISQDYRVYVIFDANGKITHQEFDNVKI